MTENIDEKIQTEENSNQVSRGYNGFRINPSVLISVALVFIVIVLLIKLFGAVIQKAENVFVENSNQSNTITEILPSEDK